MPKSLHLQGEWSVIYPLVRSPHDAAPEQSGPLNRGEDNAQDAFLELNVVPGLSALDDRSHTPVELARRGDSDASTGPQTRQLLACKQRLELCVVIGMHWRGMASVGPLEDVVC